MNIPVWLEFACRKCIAKKLDIPQSEVTRDVLLGPDANDYTAFMETQEHLSNPAPVRAISAAAK